MAARHCGAMAAPPDGDRRGCAGPPSLLRTAVCMCAGECVLSSRARGSPLPRCLASRTVTGLSERPQGLRTQGSCTALPDHRAHAARRRQTHGENGSTRDIDSVISLCSSSPPRQPAASPRPRRTAQPLRWIRFSWQRAFWQTSAALRQTAEQVNMRPLGISKKGGWMSTQRPTWHYHSQRRWGYGGWGRSAAAGLSRLTQPAGPRGSPQYLPSSGDESQTKGGGVHGSRVRGSN